MKRLNSCFAILLFLLFLSACNSHNYNTESTETATIVLIPKLVGISYFEQVREGAEEAGKTLGVNVIYDGPETANVSDQIKVVEKYIEQNVDAICIAPNDPAALISILEKAREAGITIIDWDTQADSSLVDASIRMINDKKFGEHMVDKLVEYMGSEKGEVAILTGGLDASNLNTWIKASTDYMGSHYPGLKIAAGPIGTNEDQDLVYSTTLKLIQEHPDLKGILGYSSPTAPGIAAAIRKLGMQDKIAAVATGVENDISDYLTDGSLDCGMLWDCHDLGTLTVCCANYILSGDRLQNGIMIEGWDAPLVIDGKTVFMTDTGSDYEDR